MSMLCNFFILFGGVKFFGLALKVKKWSAISGENSKMYHRNTVFVIQFYKVAGSF